MAKLVQFDAAGGYEANQLLREWLDDDAERADLFAEMASVGRTTLKFKTLAFYDSAAPGTLEDAYLVTAASDVEHALKTLSVAPYAALGGGKFMLAMDAGPEHSAQRAYGLKLLNSFTDAQLADCVRVAYRRGVVLSLKSRTGDLDLAVVAEAVALRYVAVLFGLPDEAYGVLQATVARLYRELCFQILGRHFSGEPLPPRQPVVGVKPLPDWIDDLLSGKEKIVQEGRDGKDCGRPILQGMREDDGGNDVETLKLIVLGLITGTVGNVQAAMCIALSEFFNRRDSAGSPLIVAAQRAAADDDDGALGRMIMAALTRNPPAAFLPRRADGRQLKWTDSQGAQRLIPDGADLVLALGATNRHDLVFGGVGSDAKWVHQCVGQRVVYPLLLYGVKRVLLLPNLAQSIDPVTGAPRPLAKHRAMICETYPLSFDRGRRLRQQPLAVVMNVKPPVAENAERLKRIIAAGAPAIEESLRTSEHVHFAFFILLNGGQQLALYTVYDGEFDAYIEHFALKVKLFDTLFKYIEDAPPLPVVEFPKEFVEVIRKHDVTPVGSYFFSALPRLTVARALGLLPEEAPRD
jgi:cytochrome P450